MHTFGQSFLEGSQVAVNGCSHDNWQKKRELRRDLHTPDQSLCKWVWLSDSYKFFLTQPVVVLERFLGFKSSDRHDDYLRLGPRADREGWPDSGTTTLFIVSKIESCVVLRNNFSFHGNLPIKRNTCKQFWSDGVGKGKGQNWSILWGQGLK